jgi:hypothetical protein
MFRKIERVEQLYYAALLQLAIPMLAGGISMGLSFGTVDGIASSAILEEKSGMAARLLNTFLN